MSTPSLKVVSPLSGSPSLLPLARALLDALGLGAVELPDYGQFVPRQPWARSLDDTKVSLGVEVYGVDPYGGGASSSEWMRVEWSSGRSLRASISEIAWVGPELDVDAKGPPEWTAIIDAVVHAFVVKNAR
jgi:hypothetical protein